MPDSTTNPAFETCIHGVFTGFSPQALYALEDGTYWLQTDMLQHPHHAVNPAASILNLDDGTFLKVEGMPQPVAVRPIQEVISCQIKGKFSGWSGKSTYTLTNGQVWQQAKLVKKYAVKYMPHVLVYPTDAGYVMQVAGTRVPVRQVG